MPSKKKTASPVMNVLVSVEEGYRNQCENVARKLRAAGMKVAEVFPISGTIAGEVPNAAFNKLQEIEGVSSVEEEPIFRAY